MKKVLKLGKVDYNGSGRRNCMAQVEFELKEVDTPEGKSYRFSMSAGIWNPRGTDFYCCGQMVGDLLKYFPRDQKLRRMVQVWERWHLNDMKAGSPAQEEFLRNNPVEVKYPESHYEKASKVLAEAGLNPDPNYLHKGHPYKYGSAWLVEELPVEVIAEIQSW